MLHTLTRSSRAGGDYAWRGLLTGGTTHEAQENNLTRGTTFMRALVWHGKEDVRCDKDVPDPKIEDPRDAIVKITATAICGSDLHLYDGYMPTTESGDVLGHEPMGEVVEVGPASPLGLA
jgi:alcohol dehydrogenase-like protein